jgi:hypothetical protein
VPKIPKSNAALRPGPRVCLIHIIVKSGKNSSYFSKRFVIVPGFSSRNPLGGDEVLRQ